MSKRLVKSKKLVGYTDSRGKTKRQPRLKKAKLRKILEERAGGWTNKFDTRPKKLSWNDREYDVSLRDRYLVLQRHRKEIVEPLATELGIKVDVDYESLVGQESAYGGKATDVLYVYKIPKREYEQMWKRSHGGLYSSGYFDILRERHGEQAVQRYFDAEDKALEKTFGERGVRKGQPEIKEWNDWDGYFYIGVPVYNAWAYGFDEAGW